MSKLPASPNLVYLRKQARNFLKALQEGDPEARSRVIEGHPRLSSNSSDPEVEELGLVDVQLVIAREYGFDSWAKMKAHILNVSDELISRFREALIQYDVEATRRCLDECPDLVNLRLPDGDDPLAPITSESGFQTPLHIVAYHRNWIPAHRDPRPHIELTRLLIERGADVNASDSEGEGPLVLATHEGSIESMKLLLEAGADPNMVGHGGGSALSCAAVHCDWDRCDLLMAAGAEPDLGTAAMMGDFDRVQHLLSASEYANDTLLQALDGALRFGHQEVARILVNQGIPPSSAHAAALGMDDRVKQMVANNPQLVTNPDIGEDPLAAAALNGHTNLVLWLLDHGADPNHPDDDNAAPLHQCAMGGHIAAAAVPGLVNAGAMLQAIHRGFSPLRRALSTGNLAVALALIDAGADVNEATDEEPNRLFQLADAERSGQPLELYPTVIEALIQRGAGVNETDTRGRTSLDAAIAAIKPHCAEILRRHGGMTSQELSTA